MLAIGHFFVVEQVLDVAGAGYAFGVVEFPAISEFSGNLAIARSAQIEFAIGGVELAAVPFGPCFEVGGVVECAIPAFLVGLQCEVGCA